VVIGPPLSQRTGRIPAPPARPCPTS